MSQIAVTLRCIDGFRRLRTFKTVAGASKFARKFAGDTPELGSYYAISGDGVSRITVVGAELLDLFPALRPPAPSPKVLYDGEWYPEADFEPDEPEDLRPRRFGGCTCSDAQLVHVGCDCAAGLPF